MSKRLSVLVGMVLGLLALPVLGSDGLFPDAVMINYPAGYTKLLVADVKFLSSQDLYKKAILEPLRAARQPLNGIVETLNLFKLDAAKISYVAHGEGANLTQFSLIEGAPFPATFGALQGLKFAVGAPNSPYTNYNLTEIQGIPVVFTGGTFGPVKIEWAYIPLSNRLLVGTEVAFSGEADMTRLKSSAEKMIARQLGQIPYFDELSAAVAAREGQISFVRKTDTAKDKPVESGEEAMGFAIRLDSDKATVKFFIRFQTAEQAAQAAAHLQAGQSSYLAQDLYQGQLLSAQQSDRFLTFEVATNLRGVVGLLVLVMPS